MGKSRDRRHYEDEEILERDEKLEDVRRRRRHKLDEHEELLKAPAPTEKVLENKWNRR